MPSISPNTPASTPYAIADSRAFVANSQLDFSNVPRTFTISYPDPAPAGLGIELVRITAPGGSKDLVAAVDDVVDSVSIPGRDVSVQRSTTGTVISLTCSIQDPSELGVLDEHYEVRASAAGPVTWGYDVDNDVNSNVIRLVCDPVAAYNGLPAGLLEKQLLTVTAQSASGPALTPTVVRNTNPANGLVLAPPVPTYQFGQTGPVAIPGLPSPVGTSQTYQLADTFAVPVPLPGVYGPTVVPFTVDVVYPGIGGPTFLARRGVASSTITARPQRVQLILDRSGSMGAEHRWDNAKTAARIFVNFFGEFRAGVNDQDRIGITVFEDDQGVFRSVNPSGPPFVTDVVPLDPPDVVANGNLGPAVFGNPGSSTNIGDGLFFALSKLEAAGFPANVRFTAVLMTDGDENAGTIKIGPGAEPGNPRTWTQAKLDPAIDGITGPTSDLNLFAIGLGSAPNFTVLNNLVPAGNFAAALDVGTLIDFYATMFSRSQESNKLLTRFTRVVGDPVPPNPTEIFFDTNVAHRFGVAVLKELDPPTPADVIDSVEIARWDGATFQVEKIVPKDFEGHIYLGVPNASAFTGGTATWRIRRFNSATVKPIDLTDVFAFEDLHVKSVLSLDKKDYLTGEPMVVAVEIRNDGEPVLGATVRAALDAPAEGVGSLLSALDPDDLDRQKRHAGDGKDRAHGRAALIDAILRKFDWDGLPRCNPNPGGLFEDGTDLLHDKDGDGIYTNTFRKVNADGVYNWTLSVSGDANKSPFSHRLDRSTLVQVGVSRRATVVHRETIKVPSGQQAVKITVIPQDDFKSLLGPGFDDTVIWSVEDGGRFEHVENKQPPPVNNDGSYTRTVLFRRGAKPTLRVSVNGVILPKIYLTQSRDFRAVSGKD